MSTIWTDADVTKHVKDSGDYRLNNLFDKLIINSRVDQIEEYSYDTTGEEVTRIEVYDVSCTSLMDHFYEYRDQCDVEEMKSIDTYASARIADDTYQNITFGSLILLMNNKYSNADFTLDKSSTYNILPADIVTDLILGQDAKASNTVTEITNAEDYLEMIDRRNTTKNIYKPTTDQLINSKMKTNFENIEDTPEYRRLLAEFGEDELNRIIMLLTTYNKDTTDDDTPMGINS